MINMTYPMRAEGSLPDAKLVTYIQEYSSSLAIDTRPLVLVCPGGGYRYTSDREAESIALQFLAMGYHAAVLRYSCEPAHYPTALYEIANAMLLIRKNAAKWHVDPQKIVVQGCSAGGHLAASLGVFWDEDFLAEGIGLKKEEKELLRPNGMLLCYPVITSGEFAHRGSFEQLLGDREEELSDRLSLEKRVSEKTPKAFLWHTFSDRSVPVENSLLFVSALKKAGIPTEFHMYPRGEHGLALANKLTQTNDGKALQEECSSWIGLAATWLEHLFDDECL
ncbi:MAG: alpha/beta hydrolase [Candidatus Gastranaerophilales bacterium]|nr:alpha/beta hydrolase [Candidatus Gastranaerophilales bacterium]